LAQQRARTVHIQYLNFCPLIEPCSTIMEDAPPPSVYKSLEWKDLDKSRFFLYNPLVFMALRTLQHPANVIKTRYQVQQRNTLYASPSKTLVQTLRREGIAGLYRGFSASSLMLVVQQIYIVMYEFLRASDRYTVQLSESGRNAVAAAVSVLTVQLIANPIDVVSQRLFVQGQIVSNEPMQAPAPPSTTSAVAPVATGAGTSAPNPAALSSQPQVHVKPGGLAMTNPSVQSIPRVLTGREIVSQVLRSHGLRGFYAGFFISCAQFIPSASLWWWSYPIYRQKLLAWLNATRTGAKDETAVAGAAAGLPFSAWLVGFCDVVPVARVAEVLAGSSASISVAIALNPVDIIRTRTQVEGKASLVVLKELLSSEGPRGLWKGTSARIAMLTPQGALTVAAYELVKRLSAKDELASKLEPRSHL
jgi:solute carrier family 25 protein 44